ALCTAVASPLRAACERGAALEFDLLRPRTRNALAGVFRDGYALKALALPGVVSEGVGAFVRESLAGPSWPRLLASLGRDLARADPDPKAAVQKVMADARVSRRARRAARTEA